jgi:hypothetical protein
MNRAIISRVAVAVLVTFALVGALAAADAPVALDGKIVCAKCGLKKADAKACQNVLVVKGADGMDVEYYMAKSEAADAFGMVCSKEVAAKVTGTVAEKDGRKWITASKVEKLQKS